MFESLMAQFPTDVRDSALKKIEAERPFLQAYKALMIWKEACGPDFDVRHILDALRNSGLDDLEQMTLSILDSESLLCNMYVNLIVCYILVHLNPKCLSHNWSFDVH